MATRNFTAKIEADVSAFKKAAKDIAQDGANVKKTLSNIKLDVGVKGAAAMSQEASKTVAEYNKLKAAYNANVVTLKEMNALIKQGVVLTGEQEAAQRKAREEFKAQKKDLAEYKNLISQTAKETSENLGGSFSKVNDTVKKIGDGPSFTDKFAKFGMMAMGIDQLSSSLSTITKPAIDFESSLAGLSQITGVSGDALDSFGDKARNLAKEFGGSATDQLESYKGILSRLGPDLAKSPEALDNITRSVNILSKASGLSATESMDALTTAALQFGVDLSDPVKAAEEMAKQMNVMAAGAKEGASEVPQISQALVVAGSAAKNSNVSFEETNAMLQQLAASGKYGSEAGTGLRNVLNKLGEGRFLPKEVQDELRNAGVSIEKLSDKTIPASERLKELQKIQKDGALMTKLFGAENAAAGTALVQNADSIANLTSKISGTNTAFDQAAIGMNTTQGFLDRFQAQIQDVFITLGSNKTFGALTGMAQQLAPLMITMQGIGAVVPTKAIGNLATEMLGKLIPAAVTTTTVMNAQGVAVKAQSINWKVMWGSALGPVTAIIAGLAAVTLAIGAVSKAMHTTAKEKQEELNTEMESLKVKKGIVEKNIEEENSNLRLVDQYKELASKTKLTSDEKKKLKDTTQKLNDIYPGTISNTNSLAQNMNGLTTAAEGTKNKLEKMSGQLDKLSQQEAKLAKKLIANKLDVAKLDLEDLFTKIKGDPVQNLFDKVLGFSGNRSSSEAYIAKYMKKIYSAKSQKEVSDVIDSWIDGLNAEDLGVKNYQAVVDQIRTIENAAMDAFRSERNIAPEPKTPPPTNDNNNNNITTEAGAAKAAANVDKVKQSFDRFVESLNKSSKAMADTSNGAIDILEDQRNAILQMEELTGAERIAQLAEIDKQIEDERNRLRIEGINNRKDIDKKAVQDELIRALEAGKKSNDDVKKIEKARADILADSTLTDEQKSRELIAINDALFSKILETSAYTEEQRKVFASEYAKRIKAINLSLNDEIEKNADVHTDNIKKINSQAHSDTLIANKEYYSKLLELEDGLTASSIEKKLALQKALLQIEFDAVLNKEALNADEQASYELYLKKLKELEEKANLDTKGLLGDKLEDDVKIYSDHFKKIADQFDAFTQHLTAVSKEESDKRKNELDSEKKALLQNLKDGKISYDEYRSKVGAIAEELNSLTSSVNASLIHAANGAMGGINSALEALSDPSKYKEAQEQARKSFTSYAAMGAELISSFTGYMSRFAEDGKITMEEIGKSALLSIIDLTQKGVIAFLPEILAAFSTLGPLGIPAGLAAIGSVLALSAWAKSQLGGAEDGVVDLNESNKGRPGKSDSILMALAPGESVLTARQTRQNKAALMWSKRTGRPLDEYYTNKFTQVKMNNQSVFADDRIVGGIGVLAARVGRVERATMKAAAQYSNNTHVNIGMKPLTMSGSNFVAGVDKIKRGKLRRK